MYKIVDLVKNLQTLTVDDSAFQILKDFERVIDELDIYVFDNWIEGEIFAGPKVGRYMVTCSLIWDYKTPPDPSGAARLLDYGCKIKYKKTHLLVPRKVHKPSDFRPGTKKGKIDAHPIWLVTISIPKKLMQNIYQGYREKDSNRLADLMRHDRKGQITPQQITPEIQPNAAPTPSAPPASTPSPTI